VILKNGLKKHLKNILTKKIRFDCYLFFGVTFDFHQFSFYLNSIGLWQNKGLYVLLDFKMFSVVLGFQFKISISNFGKV